MATIIDPPNSVWPNGLKVDSEGYVTFYQLGTNKVDISTITWPDGDELVSPFVYKNDKLVGFVDTEALTITDNTLIYLPYTHIEAEFSAIDKGRLQIHAPGAITKKASWKNSEKEDIPEAQFKYKGCSTVNDAIVVDANYKTTDIVNGTWSEPLWDLTNGTNMFLECSNLTSFSAGLPSLTYNEGMFQNCSNLTSFTSDLSSLIESYNMFESCSKLSSLSSDLSSLICGHYMFYDCVELSSFSSSLSSLIQGQGMFMHCGFVLFDSDLSSLINGGEMFAGCSKLTSFSSNLPNLMDGTDMFSTCKLDT